MEGFWILIFPSLQSSNVFFLPVSTGQSWCREKTINQQEMLPDENYMKSTTTLRDACVALLQNETESKSHLSLLKLCLLPHQST